MSKVELLLMVAILVIFLTYLFGGFFLPNMMGSNFSDHPTIVIHKGERYHVLLESELGDTLVIMDEQGEKHYVISERKLRLLGPKLLTGGE